MTHKIRSARTLSRSGEGSERRTVICECGEQWTTEGTEAYELHARHMQEQTPLAEEGGTQ